jgi:membrane-associated phospholipid phosphatase
MNSNAPGIGRATYLGAWLALLAGAFLIGLNPIDYYTIKFLNGFAHRSVAFDEFVGIISWNYLLKTGLLTFFLLWYWFQQEDDDGQGHRSALIFGLIASWAAVLFARILSFALPFRERPLRESDLHFVLPYSVDRDAIFSWSALPSDNAALFFGIAACIFCVSRRAGIIAFCHVLVVVGFARVYLGYHHPTDILAGGLVGAGAVSLIQIPAVKEFVTRVPLRWLRLYPQCFNTVFLFLIFFSSTTFEPLYPIVHAAIAAAKRLLSA